MASFIYSVRTTQKDANADVMVRIRFSAYVEGKKVDTYAQSGVKIPKKAWDDKKAAIKSAFTSTANSANEGKTLDNLQNDLNEIKAFVFQRYNMLGEERISTQWLEGIITEYWDIRRQIVEDERQVKEALANKETFNQYISRYINEIESGTRLTNKNTKYKTGTVKAVKASMVQFANYQKATKCQLDFTDINLDFYRNFTHWLAGKGYTTNSIGKCVKDLKNILANAQEEGLHNNDEYKGRRFKVTAEEADNVYLTAEELDALAKVDLSTKAQGYSDARDVFLAGCWLAQRVSDYNHLSPENIETRKETALVGDKIVEMEKTYVVLIQKKTGSRVRIPVNKQLQTILTKYQNKLPYIWEQKLNQYIKIIAEMAGITQTVEIATTKGGEKRTEWVPKCNLIKSHTARRTGATLMYLSGMDVFDICRITGHTSIKTLRKYIKADELDVAEKMRKYQYFD